MLSALPGPPNLVEGFLINPNLFVFFFLNNNFELVTPMAHKVSKQDKASQYTFKINSERNPQCQIPVRRRKPPEDILIQVLQETT